MTVGETLFTYRKMRILIAEEALQTGSGHWPSYIGCIAEGMRVAGDDVDILMHERAGEKLVGEMKGVPWFSRNCWIDKRSQGAWGVFQHNIRFRRELRRWILSHEPYDWVCALTMRLQHLLAYALLVRDGGLPEKMRFLLLFVQGFGVYAGLGEPTRFPGTVSNRMARLCFRLLAPAVRAGRVVLAAETKGMQEELERFTGLPVSLYPHPVPAPEGGVARTREVADPVTISCPGFARHEKGNDLLQEAILGVLGESESDRLRFVMQWPEAFALPDGRLLTADARLAGDSRVRLVNESLNGAAYEALLRESDFVILPYRRNSYHHRVSRVAIEAASRGIPLIYTSGTWTEEVAEPADCGVEIKEETSESVRAAIEVALRDVTELRSAAVRGAPRVTEFHSAARFRSLLSTNQTS